MVNNEIFEDENYDPAIIQYYSDIFIYLQTIASKMNRFEIPKIEMIYLFTYLYNYLLISRLTKKDLNLI